MKWVQGHGHRRRGRDPARGAPGNCAGCRSPRYRTRATEHGRPQRAYAMFRDLTRERRAAAALREGTELMGLLREANVIGVVVNGEDHVHDANDAFLGIIGYPREDVAAGRISREKITPPEWRRPDADAHRQRRATGRSAPTRRSTCTGTGTGCRPGRCGGARLPATTLGDLRGRPDRPAARRAGAGAAGGPGTDRPG